MKCQATCTEEATEEIPSRSGDGPYRLCAAAVHRLRSLTLRPLEWYRLAIIHGPLEFHLHDDFYNEDGSAYQPQEPVVDAALHPCPTLDQCASALDPLLDFASTRWHLREEVIEKLQAFRSQLLPVVSVRFERTRNYWFQERFARIASETLGADAGPWLCDILKRFDPPHQLGLLAGCYKGIGKVQGLSFAFAALAKISGREAVGTRRILALFQDASVLDWIESHVDVNVTEEWGDAAAASQLDWARVEKWLATSRPLSLVALDALCACAGPRPGQAPMMRHIAPRLKGGVGEVITRAVQFYAARDRVPRVTRAARFIEQNIGKIAGS